MFSIHLQTQCEERKLSPHSSRLFLLLDIYSPRRTTAWCALGRKGNDLCQILCAYASCCGLAFFPPASRQTKWWLQDRAGAKSCSGVWSSTGLTDYLKWVKAGTRQVFSSYLLCSSLGESPWETGMGLLRALKPADKDITRINISDWRQLDDEF